METRRHNQSDPNGRAKRGGGSAGFTLLELMIALAIFMMLVGILIGFSREVSKSWTRLRREQGLFSELLVLDRTLDAMLINVIPFVWPGAEPEDDPRPAFQGSPDRLRMAYQHRLNSVQDGAIRFVALEVVDGDLLAHYQQRPFLTWEDLGDGAAQTSVLSHGVESIEFLYADLAAEAEDVEWLAEWRPEDEDENEKKRKVSQLPLAVMVKIHWQDGRTESWLRRTSGSGFRERFGQWKPKPTT
ncbi:MAG: prepilin-type N-terminal cleavage/methylation domain-containing protein [Lentisphaerae bacterium]|jgi:prepilin-type N-terminal cleavage/methylation domain-containing protein|nr:prepilin-type N-terminal cleavage/methylation domain-containing protein [Lentisphaerota bacterium]MBT4816184.1 prepilin-type N-terminal cleavage/methylation domain-containing protein [Lentisphaerota bacterium]MBT5606629.1 prepilin-type N-terminal cleavage/methylation domain-containing protein [Lentisphaerota bacterium]MBT7059528.1 prepilin-type N-terminal cleavage/methylation domain-containing protein [Lentisphaerota bacterium]MBT7843035.1 prepilin-type N-terminal cleavage/methylation domain